MFKLSLLMTWRDLRAGELRFLMLALVLAIASLSSVQFFADRMDGALARDANQLLGGDLRISAEQPLDRAWRREAELLGLLATDTVELRSMATGGDGEQATSRMVLLKAVGPGYPLRGRLTLHDGAAVVPAAGIPATGTAWVDPALLASMNLRIGQSIEVGARRLMIARTIAAEPDRGLAGMNFAPRVLMSLQDLPATGLAQPGALASWDLLLAGEPRVLEAYHAWGKMRLAAPGAEPVRIDTLATITARTSEALGRASTFLALIGLLTAMLASVAVAMAARRFMLRHADACAMLRCLGLGHRQVILLFVIELLLVGVAASAVGVMIGFAGHFLLVGWLGSLLTADIPAAGAMPALHGMAVGVLLLAGFALPPLLQLRDIPHNRLLRREASAPAPRTIVFSVIGLASFALLMVWQSRDLVVGAATVGAFAIALLVFAAAARAAIAALRFVPASLDRGVLRLALADMRRRPGAMVTQVVALGLGLMALMLMTVVRTDLLDSWTSTARSDAPTHAIYGVQPHQKDDVGARLVPYGARLHALMPARLLSLNGKAFKASDYQDKIASKLLEREIDISTASALPPSNTLVAGAWFAEDSDVNELSVSDTSARALGIKLGDKITLNFSGTSSEFRVSSLRKVDWNSGGANFGFLINPAAARGLAATYVAAVHVPVEDTSFVNHLVRDHANVTVIDTGALVRQFVGVLRQVSKAVEFLFVFTLAAGVLVLYAVLAATQDERQRQAAILRALGASRAQLSRAQQLEYALSGALAGLLAGAGASAASWAIARFALKLEWEFSPLILAGGLAAGAACALIGAWAGLRAVLATSPLQTLRSQ